MVRQWQDINYEGRHPPLTESIPDFTQAGRSLWSCGIRVENRTQLEQALHDMQTKYKDRLVFLDVSRPEEHVYPMQVPGGSMRDMWLSKTERT